MKHFSLFCALLIIVVFIFGCGNQAPTDAALSESQSENSSNEAVDNTLRKSSRNFVAHLSGDEEVPPVATQAQGQSIFHLSKDGTSLNYKLIVANIDNVTQAHIHRGPAGQNGPVVTFLFGFVPGGVTTNGVLAEGSITEADLIGPLAGQPLSALLNEMNNGNTYVNVHTVSFPPGEIRGQIQ
jgi:hypothetical protein